MTNQNTAEYLEKIKTRLFENLRMLPHAPGVQMQPIPEDAIDQESEDEDKQDGDERISIRASEKRIARDDEFSDSEDEGDGRRDNRSHKPKAKKSKVEANSTSASNANNNETKDKNNDESKKKDEPIADSTDKKPTTADTPAEVAEPEPPKAGDEKSESTKIESSSPNSQTVGPTPGPKGDVVEKEKKTSS
ncbi:unnamed protein product [Medioppia subpectinata]|uniref:Uncharacterized protein n=1 Tax=Medioppia subpectinata TaxID=1979941 RepID=A0A7R9LFU5_9ACAR|nr:unnamed protein product [Medioppia subpectinata]CAG2118077.1 unnamed protein product [Medioppia subpectinata]